MVIWKNAKRWVFTPWRITKNYFKITKISKSKKNTSKKDKNYFVQIEDTFRIKFKIILDKLNFYRKKDKNQGHKNSAENQQQRKKGIKFIKDTRKRIKINYSRHKILAWVLKSEDTIWRIKMSVSFLLEIIEDTFSSLFQELPVNWKIQFSHPDGVLIIFDGFKWL